MTTSDPMSDSKWQRLMQEVTTSENEWYNESQQMTTSDNK